YVNGQPDSAGDGVTFEVTSGSVAPGETVVITATAQAGYVLANGETTQTFTHTFATAASAQAPVAAQLPGTASAGAGQVGQAGAAGQAGTAGTAGTGATAGTTSGGAGVLASESSVPTVVPAGQAGAERTMRDLRPLAALLFTGGLLLLI